MKRSRSYPPHPKHLENARALKRERARESSQRPAAAAAPPPASTIRVTPRDFTNPVGYPQHSYESMARFAQALARGDGPVLMPDGRCRSHHGKTSWAKRRS